MTLPYEPQRRSTRLPVRLPLQAHVGGAGIGIVLAGTLRDVSPEGLSAIFPEEALAVGMLLKLLLLTKVGPLALEARVVWARRDSEGFCYGFEFLDPKDRDFAIGVFLSENRPQLSP